MAIRSRSPGDARVGLSASVRHHLDVYALSATAAGVGALALARSAEARIIYTPANLPIVDHSKLDLNHDHKADFTFFTHRTSTPDGSAGSSQLRVYPVGTKNRIWGTLQYASALSSGDWVGPNKPQFRPGHDVMGTWVWHCCRPGALSTSTRGQWPRVHLGYLGLKFFIRGQIHYGWARISMKYPITLTGYAYETIANKGIVTGKTKGPDEVTYPADLGRLARGSSAVSTGRKSQPLAPRR